MTEHVYLRIRTTDGAYAIVSPTDIDEFEITVLGEGRQPVEPPKHERALELLLRVTSQIRKQTFEMLQEIKKKRAP